MRETDNKEDYTPSAESEVAAKDRFASAWKLLLVLFALFAVGLIVYFVVFHKKEDNPLDHVTLAENYDCLKYEAPDTKVSDEEVEEYIQGYIKHYTHYFIDDERDGTEVKTGDIVNCEFTVSKDGKKSDAVQENITVGSGECPALEDVLLGCMVGEEYEKTVDIDKKSAEKISGLSEVSGAKLSIKINYICDKFVPEMDDDFAETASGGDCTKAADFPAWVRNKLENEKKTETEDSLREILITKLIEGSSFKDLDGLVKDNYDTVIKTYNELAKASGMSLEKYVSEYYSMNIDDFDSTIKEMSEELLKERLVLLAVADKEGLTVKKDSEEYKNMLEKYITDSELSGEKALFDIYGEQELLESMTMEKAREFIYSHSIKE